MSHGEEYPIHMDKSHQRAVGTNTRELVILPLKDLATSAAIMRPTAATYSPFWTANRGVCLTQP